MHQAADDGRRELSAPHSAKVAKRAHIDGAQLRDGRVDSSGQAAQDFRDLGGADPQTFRLKGRELFRGECVAAGVREEAIDDAGDMTYVKCDGCDTRRAGVPFLRRQVPSPASR